MRPCEVFLRERGVLLGDHGFTPDPGRLETTDSTIVFYHYTRAEKVETVLEAGSGLWARLRVLSEHPDLAGLHLAEGLLEPLPKWMTDSPYFGDLGYEMLKKYVGDLLLRVEVPRDFPGLYVADYGHMLELEASHQARPSGPRSRLRHRHRARSRTERDELLHSCCRVPRWTPRA